MKQDRDRGNPIHILLVEDDPEAIRTVWNMLHEKSRYKYHVEAVTRLPEALNRLEAGGIDAILLDLALTSHQAERDAVTAVKEASPGAAVIVLTTLEDEQAGLNALEQGADDYLLKEEIGTRMLVRSLHYAVERKLYEAALTLSEGQYRALANLSPDAILVSVNGQYAYANPSAVDLVGAEDEEQILGCGTFELSAEEYAAADRLPRASRPIRSPQAAVRESMWRRFDGTNVDVEVVSTPIIWQDQEAVLVLGREVTERKILEQERAALLEREHAARAEAERAVAIQRLFLGMVSHELRTPLASIKGFSSSILATDVSFGPEQVREFVSIIDTEADRLTALITQLMDVVQVQAGVLRVEAQPAKVSDIVESVMPQMETLTTEHRLEVSLPDDLPPVLADAPRIGQVLVNLVGNAAKFSPPQSPVIVSATVRDRDVFFQVTDAGVGIPPDKRDQVFEVFYQVEDAGTRKPGTGLGLAICRGLVEAHGGSIWVEDIQRTGTTVAFTLPVAMRSDA